MRIGIIYSLVDDNCKIAESYNEVLSTVEEIYRILEKHGHKVVPCRLAPTLDGVKRQILKLKDSTDFIINLGEGINGDSTKEKSIAKIMSDNDIIYTGSPCGSFMITSRKNIAKDILMKVDLPTPQFQVFNSTDDTLSLDFPVIVKPCYEDGSIGITSDSVVNTTEDLKRQVNHILTEYNQPAMVEEYIEGREFNVGIVGNESLTPLSISEIIFKDYGDKPKILTYDGKWNEESPEYKCTTSTCVTNIDKVLASKLVDISKKAFNLFGLRDYGRIDFRVRKKEVFLLEVNANPCINPVDSGFANQLKGSNISYEEFVLMLVHFAKLRIDEREYLRTENLAFERARSHHLPYLTRWFNDRNIGKYMDDSDETYTEEAILQKFTKSDYSFVINSQNKPMGFCSLYNINKRSMRGEISFFIGEKEYLGLGLSNEIVCFLLKYGLEYLGLNSLFASVSTPNKPSLKVIERAGFKQIGVRRQYENIDGVLVDELLFDITAQDFKTSPLHSMKVVVPPMITHKTNEQSNRRNLT